MLVALVTAHKLVIVLNFVIIQRGTPESVWPCLVKFAYKTVASRKHNPQLLRAMSIQVETSPGWISPRGSSSKVEIKDPVGSLEKGQSSRGKSLSLVERGTQSPSGLPNPNRKELCQSDKFP